MSKKMAMVVFVVVLTLLTSHSSVNAISCSDGVRALVPCAQFLMGSGSNQPTSACCVGAQNLNSMASTVQDRRFLCQCFKNAAGSYGINTGRAEALPQMCHINLKLDISPAVDCSRIE